MPQEGHKFSREMPDCGCARDADFPQRPVMFARTAREVWMYGLAKPVACALALVAGGTAAVADRREERIGDIAIGFDSSVWSLAAEGGTYRCLRAETARTSFNIEVTVEPDTTPCSREAMGERATQHNAQAWEADLFTIARPDFDVHVALQDLGCRAWTGRPVFACLAYRGKVYSFTAATGACRNTMAGSEGPVLDLLSGFEGR